MAVELKKGKAWILSWSLRWGLVAAGGKRKSERWSWVVQRRIDGARLFGEGENFGMAQKSGEAADEVTREIIGREILEAG